jgi:hypothetical protein
VCASIFYLKDFNVLKFFIIMEEEEEDEAGRKKENHFVL